MEAGRPDTITREKLELIRKAGAQRISINPQTTCAATLPIIGRKHSVQAFFEAAQLAKEFDFEAVNMDLIAGLPGEGVAQLLQSVRDCIALGPENITVHTLAIKKGSKFGMENVGQFASAQEAEQMVEQARVLLEAHGYLPYYMYRQKYMSGNLENVGYARPERICRYNIDMMEESVSILAHGAGAMTKRVFAEENRIERVPAPKDVPTYAEKLLLLNERKLRQFLD